MRISTPWTELNNCINNASIERGTVDSILLIAAMKKKEEIEQMYDIELSDTFIKEMLKKAEKKGKNNFDARLRFIKRYSYNDEDSE